MNAFSSTFHGALIAVALSLAVPATVLASESELPLPQGDVLLTVSGDISVTNGDGQARFDRAMLAELDGRSFVTTTIWTEGEQEFAGVGLDTLLARLGVEGGTLTATAINDYSVEIPVSEAREDGPIIAYEQNGSEMSVRDKGPLWIVYPYDTSSEFQSEITYSRSIWQLDRITVSQ